MSRRPAPQPVRVTTAGATVTVSPAGPLLGDLRVGRLELDCGRGPGLVGVNRPLFLRVPTAGGGDDAVAWAGLTSVVVGLHKANGVPVTVVGSESISFAPAGGPPRPLDPAVVALPARARRALVRYGDAVDPLDLAAQLVAAYGGVNVVALVRSRRERAALLSRVNASAAAGAVSVCTLGRSGLAGLERAGLVLVLDALHATWADPLTAQPAAPVAAVGLMDRLGGLPAAAAVVGFLPLGRPRSPFELARAWQLYGPDELVVPAHGVVGRPVEVAAHRVDLGRRVGEHADALAVKKALWRDPVRNRRLAALARAVAAGDAAALAADFPGTAVGAAATPRSVLVLCEGLDQAAAVSKRLPGWRVVAGTGEAGTAPIDVAAGGANGLIATALGVQKTCGGDFDVVVRADPGRGPPPLPPHWTHGRTLRPLLVVDADDAGHPLARRWSRQRRGADLAAGWPAAGTDPDLFAWHRFRALVLNRGASS